MLTLLPEPKFRRCIAFYLTGYLSARTFITSGEIRPLFRVLKELKNRIAASPLIRSQPVQLTFRVFKEMKDDDATHLAARVAPPPQFPKQHHSQVTRRLAPKQN